MKARELALIALDDLDGLPAAQVSFCLTRLAQSILPLLSIAISEFSVKNMAGQSIKMARQVALQCWELANLVLAK